MTDAGKLRPPISVMPHPDQKSQSIRSSEAATSFSALARVVVAISIAILASLLIAISAFRSSEAKAANTVVSPTLGTKPEVNPFRP